MAAGNPGSEAFAAMPGGSAIQPVHSLAGDERNALLHAGTPIA
jgi:hypothetical protein